MYVAPIINMGLSDRGEINGGYLTVHLEHIPKKWPGLSSLSRGSLSKMHISKSCTVC